jgi:TetR/AcrR family transcriptional regulator
MQALNNHMDSPESSSIDRIQAAAEALFSEHGYDAVSMNAIAEKAGVSKANIFHHFSTKNALYLAVVKDACKESQNRLQQMENSQGSFAERLSSFARMQLLSMLENSQTTRLILRDLLEHGEQRGQQLAEEVFGQHFARLVDMIREGQARGELRKDISPSSVALMLLATNVYFFEARDLLRHYPDVDCADDPARFSSKMLQLMLHGILPSPKE